MSVENSIVSSLMLADPLTAMSPPSRAYSANTLYKSGSKEAKDKIGVREHVFFLLHEIPDTS
jgi:hypothetical protein